METDRSMTSAPLHSNTPPEPSGRSSISRLGATSSQRPISRADTAPRMNAAMSQSLEARQDLLGQCQSRRSRSDARPAKPFPATTHLRRLGAHETHLGVQPCEEAYPAARIRQCGKLKQGTADGSRTPLIAEATGRRAAVNRPPVRSAQVSPAPTPSTGRAA